MRPLRRFLFGGVLFLVGGLSVGPLGAHQVSSVSLVSRLDTEEKSYHLDIAMEVIPSEDQAVNDQISPEDAAREFAVEYLNVLFDEKEVTPEMEISLEKTSDEDTPETLQRQQVVVSLEGTFPAGAREFLLYLDPTCPMAVIMVVIKDEKPSRRMQVILAGEYSRPVNIEPMMEGDPFVSAEQAKAEPVGEPAKGAAGNEMSGGSNEAGGGEASSKKPCPLCAGWASFFDGSLLPALLVAAIIILTLKGRSVFHQLAVFLIAQGVAIVLSIWQLIPSLSWVLVAAAVVLVILSLEAVFHHELRWWRLVVVAIGGTSAGLLISKTPGFLEIFSGGNGVSLKDAVLFILGTELGFLVAGLVVAAVLIPLSRKNWYRKTVVQPLATVLTAYGVFLIVEPLL